jgi:glycosyltransferase involved in cell wall biosynthesis
MVEQKTIGIDARFYGPLGKGLGRYTQEIADRIIRSDSGHRYVIFLGRENFDSFEMPAGAANRVKKVLADIRWYSLAEQLRFPGLVRRERIDLMHFPHFNVPLFTPARFIVTVHDLILTKFPTVRATTLPPLLYKLKDLAYRLVIGHALRRSLHVLTVSEFTKQDIIKRFKIDSSKITVTYEGVADLGRRAAPAPASVLEKYHLRPGFWLYVGNAYPHKNLEKLIQAFDIYRRKHPEARLVLVGKEDFFYSRLKQFAGSLGLYSDAPEKDLIIFAGYVPDSDLKILFKEALGYVFPSLYEGFGLPPLEAMANGCPVLSSDRSCLPEILGEAAGYFDPTSENSLSSLMERLVTDEAWRMDLIGRGRKQVLNFSWQECAAKTLEIYQRYAD